MEGIITAVDDGNRGIFHESFRRFGLLEPAHDTIDVAADVLDFAHEVANGEVAVLPELVIGLAAQFFHANGKR